MAEEVRAVMHGELLPALQALLAALHASAAPDAAGAGGAATELGKRVSAALAAIEAKSVALPGMGASVAESRVRLVELRAREIDAQMQRDLLAAALRRHAHGSG